MKQSIIIKVHLKRPQKKMPQDLRSKDHLSEISAADFYPGQSSVGSIVTCLLVSDNLTSTTWNS